jgi:thymidylate synthase (FAD)
MPVKLISITQPVVEFCKTPGELVAYCARVSNPANQTAHDTSAKLLKYCFENRHWSIFEMVSLCFEIVTTRDIGRQIIRHRSFSFQEFSQRYAKATEFEIRSCRLQDKTNRQNSIINNDYELNYWWNTVQLEVQELAEQRYKEALDKNIAKEQARVLLPEGITRTTMYMNGTLRSWIHYCHIRCGEHTQLEHRLIASEIREKISEVIPEIKDII